MNDILTATADEKSARSALAGSAQLLLDTTAVAAAVPLATQINPSAKTLKRCLSVPIIHTPPMGKTVTTMTTRSAAAAAAAVARSSESTIGMDGLSEALHETPKKGQNHQLESGSLGEFRRNIHIGIPRSNPSSREVSPAPVFNIFSTRARRYSASSFSPLGSAAGACSPSGAALCLTPRVSQLRQEECIDMNSREVNHEREVHSVMQMSQSWEDLTLVTENWSCKSDDMSNPLQVSLPTGVTSCSSPSPTNNRAGMRLPYGLSPSPTRRTFATRRSMSPIAIRPSTLGPVKRKFDMEDNNVSNWNVYSPPPMKKMFTESRGSSPVCQSPSSICPSPDSGTYDGRITPKLFISKLCTTNTNPNSTCSSPMSASPGGSLSGAIDSTATSGICSSSSSSASSVSGGSEPMCIGSSIDEGICEPDDKLQCPTTSTSGVQAMSTDLQDEATLMDDTKSETSSIGCCSSISIDSVLCDSSAKPAPTFLNKLNADELGAPIVGQKQFFINKQGLSGARKFIVNHESSPINSSEPMDSASVSSTTNEKEAMGAELAGAVGSTVMVEDKLI